mmetsp:Transcript_11380/g.36409  ORF Transcript_11380/g.36409 Transcript_11380/m.36409 type:complete len:208 (+) Transcript_11380:552-1175(+)
MVLGLASLCSRRVGIGGGFLSSRLGGMGGPRPGGDFRCEERRFSPFWSFEFLRPRWLKGLAMLANLLLELRRFSLSPAAPSPGGGGSTPRGLCLVEALICSLAGMKRRRSLRMRTTSTPMAGDMSMRACSGDTSSGATRMDGAKQVARLTGDILLYFSNCATSRRKLTMSEKHSRLGDCTLESAEKTAFSRSADEPCAVRQAPRIGS